MTQNIFIIAILISAIFGSASAFHYKHKLEEIRMKNHINDKNTIQLVRTISALAEDIRIATYPGECDILTKEIIGEECDLGNYMEWAGPKLENKTATLLNQLSALNKE